MAKFSTSLPCLPPKQGYLVYIIYEKSPWAWSLNTDRSFLGECQLVQAKLMLRTVITEKWYGQLHCESQFPCQVKCISIVIVISSFCKFLQRPLSFIMLNVIAKFFTLIFKPVFSLFMSMLNSAGPSTDPCGTLQQTLFQCENSLFTSSCWFLSFNQLLIYAGIFTSSSWLLKSLW